MTERFMVDDCGTLIDMESRNTYDYVSDVCGLLNELHEFKQNNEELREENKQLKRRLMIMEDKVKGLMK